MATPCPFFIELGGKPISHEIGIRHPGRLLSCTRVNTETVIACVVPSPDGNLTSQGNEDSVFQGCNYDKILRLVKVGIEKVRIAIGIVQPGTRKRATPHSPPPTSLRWEEL
ncbi:hypothetical protein YTPLAS18_08480 [Nitrospira sp.]|nr:hypothetical protein YTPLAS18_08480 [Nitrospira sp.]